MLLKLPFYDWIKSLDDYPQYFDSDKYWLDVTGIFLIFLVAVFTLGLIIYGIYSLIDKKSETKEILIGVLVDKRYIGESDSTGVGTAMMPSGGIGVVSTSSHSDEEFLFFIKADKVYKCEVDMQQFYNNSIGDAVNVNVFTGGLSKKILKAKLV